MRIHILLTIILCASASCKRDEHAEAPPADKASPAMRDRAPDQPLALEPSQDFSSIARRLEWESRNRPLHGVTTERVFDALDRADVPVRGKRQYLGVTMQASYCAGGVTPDGVAISVCEYATPEAAKAGKRFMERRFAAMTPHAKRILRGHTLLTIAQPSAGVGSEIATRAVQTFTSL